jgi:hypothetical protein
MTLASAPWYSPTSGSFWVDIIAIAGIAATVIMGMAALPRRRLNCTVVSRSRLIAAPQEMQADLKVSYQNGLLNHPYVVALEIVNTGRSSIPSSSFDDGQSLELSLAVPILKILSTEHEPASAPKPTLSNDSEHIVLGKGRIAKREIIRLSLLTEDIPPGALTVSLDPFNDVKIRTSDREASEVRRGKMMAIGAVTLAVTTVAVTIIGAYLTVPQSITPGVRA